MQFTIFHFYKLNFLKKNYYVEHVTKFIPCVGEKKSLERGEVHVGNCRWCEREI